MIIKILQNQIYNGRNLIPFLRCNLKLLPLCGCKKKYTLSFRLSSRPNTVVVDESNGYNAKMGGISFGSFPAGSAEGRGTRILTNRLSLLLRAYSTPVGCSCGNAYKRRVRRFFIIFLHECYNCRDKKQHQMYTGARAHNGAMLLLVWKPG